MKKFFGVLISCFVIAIMTAGCGSKVGSDTGASGTEAVKAAAEESKRLSVVTTIFPAYDWVKAVVGDNKNVDITFLIDKGVDLHSYQVSAADIAKITDSNLFVFVGGESDEWAEGIIHENPELKFISMVDSIGDHALKEELVEGMQEEAHEHDHEGEEAEHDAEATGHDEHDSADAGNDEHDHDHEEAAHGDHDHEGAVDEHVWLSLENAKIIVGNIADKLSEIDPANGDMYRKNAEEYTAKLDELDAEYKEALSNVSNKTILVGDRFPFRYLVNEYGINYYAAFMGCDAESEASFETVAFLAKKIDELKLSKIFIIDGSNGELARTIVDNTADKNAEILVLDSMQSTKSSDNASYLDIMKKNLEVLKSVL